MTTDALAPVKTKTPRSDYDNPWKKIFNIYFQDFMKFCLPQIAEKINWSKGYEPMDKEFQAMTRRSKITKRTADKLIKVWRTNGKPSLVLCHLEIELQPAKKLPRRMLIYRYRIYDHFKLPIISVAILIDDSPTWRKDCYRHTCFGTYLEIRYIVVKVLDYQKRRQELEALNNPFAIVLLAQLTVLETKDDPNARLKAKTALTRSLYEKGYNKEDIIALYELLDWIITLPEELMLKYERAITLFEEENHVNHITTAEWVGMQKGELIGIQKGERIGIQKGKRIGIQKGVQQGEVAILIHQLQRRFQQIPAKFLKKIKQADADTLLLWAARLLDAQILEDVFK